MKGKYGLGMVVLWTVIFTACMYPQDDGGMVANGLEKKFKNMTSPSRVLIEGENMGDLKIRSVLKNILELKEVMNLAPTEASLDPFTWEIRESVLGKEVDVEKTVEAIMTADEGDVVEPVIIEVQPKRNTEYLQSKLNQRGSYITFFNTEDEARTFNIKKASLKIHHYKLLPNEDFSFNEVVGKCSVENGYQYAPVIIRTEEGSTRELGEGGGVCQVSSTLYNATLEASLEILERHSHSEAVGYVPMERDATIVWGVFDFRFKNTRSYPIMIKSEVEENRLTVRIIENSM
jgi:vancomycin resistance protein YoaR